MKNFSPSSKRARKDGQGSVQPLAPHLACTRTTFTSSSRMVVSSLTKDSWPGANSITVTTYETNNRY
ncbi:hypothetical protein E2C01_016858 [Portunus trituberculatus]|uniref:Uncharacterized protein n=1 Tax=Portunus trituberculatus TaxID=210409 RepID=A0A5B7DS15_PORTR|nr:hypothetical protein [Portunus trituberculatus]